MKPLTLLSQAGLENAQKRSSRRQEAHFSSPSESRASLPRLPRLIESVPRWSWLLIAALVLCLAGCKRAAKVDATQPLQQSFQTAEPEVQQAIAKINTSLKANDYAGATRALAPLVSERPLSDQQRQAVGVALQQINQAVAANPSLDTKEMYELRAKMFQAMRRGSRF